MDQDRARQILRSVRDDQHRMGKPTDKRYILIHDFQRQDEELVAKAERRNEANLRTLKQMGVNVNSSYVLANAVCDMASELQYDSAVCRVSRVGHCFCFVNYPPDAEGLPAQRPQCIQDMAVNDLWASAWVIDPWMNIACPSTDYRNQAMMKLLKWAVQGKYVSGQIGPNYDVNNLTPVRFGTPLHTIDQSDPVIIGQFFTSRLKYPRIERVELADDRFLTMKPANPRN